jgi:hypothetical protein
MRQGGLSPKGHNSGVYWTRVASKKKQKENTEQNQKANPLDLDRNGIVTPLEIKIVVGIQIASWVAGFCFMGFLIYLAILGSKP